MDYVEIRFKKVITFINDTIKKNDKRSSLLIKGGLRMVKNLLFTKTKMSEIAGLSESNGRRWVKHFKEYIPYEKHENRTMYNSESVRILSFLRDMNQNGLTMAEVKIWVMKNGIPESEVDANKIIDENKIETVSHIFDVKIAKKIPSIKDMLILFLNELKDGEIYSAAEITERVAKLFNLTDYERVMRYESNTDSIFLSRIRSVRYSLKEEGYIEEVNKLTYQITKDGLELLNESRKEIESEIEEMEKIVDPITIVKQNIAELEDKLAEDLLKEIQKIHWVKFEDIVIELLTVMGYGDGEVTQRSNDEGLDGVIKEDKLGLDNIYVQAKRYKEGNSVGRDAVQSFSGALDSKGARKGVFITTSYFTKGAKEYAERLEVKKIILISGKEMANLMISYNVGVNNKLTFVVKDLDYGYFKEE